MLKLDLFISIHTNSVAGGKTVKGASTWTLGLAKSDANLEVAKRENSVILYESDYKTRYAGFNPNSAESYIIFEFMQDKYMSQSVHLASLVQKEFRHTCKRADRGVHQAGFLVLKASAMPSILVELGFISNPEEERYLNSEAGTTTLANGIFRAFLSYKREHEIRMTGSSRTLLPEDTDAGRVEEEIPASPVSNNTETKQNTEKVADRQTDSAAPVFKIQILTSSRPLAANDKRLKGLKGVEYYQEGGLCKYTYGASTDYNKVLRTKREIAPKFKDAFIIAFKNGKKTRPPARAGAVVVAVGTRFAVVVVVEVAEVVRVGDLQRVVVAVERFAVQHAVDARQTVDQLLFAVVVAFAGDDLRIGVEEAARREGRGEQRQRSQFQYAFDFHGVMLRLNR